MDSLIARMRAVLPQRRRAETFDHRMYGIDWKITIGFYDDGVTPGEVFCAGAKAGTDLDSTTRDGAILLSLAIQHHIPIDTIQRAVTRNGDGSPSTIIGVIVDKMAVAQ